MTALPLDLPFAGVAAFTDMRPGQALPVTDQPWPPPRYNPVSADIRLWSAWHSGNPDELMRAYYAIGTNSPVGRQYFSTTGEAGAPSPRPGQYRGGLLGSIRRWFWGQPVPQGEKRSNVHVPLAGDLASTSSNLLFAQSPALASTAGAGVQDYLSGLVDDGTRATLTEAAEIAAALGGIYLRVVWDTDISDRPWLDWVPPDCAVPEFRYGRLVAVTFWSVIRDEGKDVIQHLEKHIPARNAILHGVYHGTQKNLGRPMALTDFEETAPYAEVLTEGNAITFPDQPKDASTVVYVPNMRPNRIWRELGPQAEPLGRSDYSGVEGLMDSLDEAFSSWMRDIRVGKARLIVPQSMLQSLGRGRGAVLDLEREVMVPVGGLVTGESAVKDQILPQQFDIRWQAHQQTCQNLIETIITQAGYSGQTLGLQGDIAQTATEVVARERKSLTTRGKKINYWRPGLADIIYGLMSIDAAVFGSPLEPVRPDVEWPDAVLPDQLELAQTVAAMRGAEAASVETAVATMHPDWKPELIAAEVQRIYDEVSISMLGRARIAVGATPGESLPQELSEIPDAVGAATAARQAEQAAESQDLSGNG